MEFKTIAILNDGLMPSRVRSAGAYQFTDYVTRKVNIIAPVHKADNAIKQLFNHYELVNMFDKFFLITAKGKTEITEMEYNELKRQTTKNNDRV